MSHERYSYGKDYGKTLEQLDQPDQNEDSPAEEVEEIIGKDCVTTIHSGAVYAALAEQLKRMILNVPMKVNLGPDEASDMRPAELETMLNSSSKKDESKLVRVENDSQETNDSYIIINLDKTSEQPAQEEECKPSSSSSSQPKHLPGSWIEDLPSVSVCSLHLEKSQLVPIESSAFEYRPRKVSPPPFKALFSETDITRMKAYKIIESPKFSSTEKPIGKRQEYTYEKSPSIKSEKKINLTIKETKTDVQLAKMKIPLSSPKMKIPLTSPPALRKKSLTPAKSSKLKELRIHKKVPPMKKIICKKLSKKIAFKEPEKIGKLSEAKTTTEKNRLILPRQHTISYQKNKSQQNKIQSYTDVTIRSPTFGRKKSWAKGKKLQRIQTRKTKTPIQKLGDKSKSKQNLQRKKISRKLSPKLPSSKTFKKRMKSLKIIQKKKILAQPKKTSKTFQPPDLLPEE